MNGVLIKTNTFASVKGVGYKNDPENRDRCRYDLVVDEELDTYPSKVGCDESDSELNKQLKERAEMFFVIDKTYHMQNRSTTQNGALC